MTTDRRAWPTGMLRLVGGGAVVVLAGIGGCGGASPAEIRALSEEVKLRSGDRRVEVARELRGIIRRVVVEGKRKDEVALGALREYAVPALGGCLDDANVAMRIECSHGLAAMGEDAKAAAESLARRVTSDPESEVRRHAVAALGSIGRARLDVTLAALARAIEDEDESVRSLGSDGLGRLGQEALPYIVKSMASRSAGTRLAAVEALGPLGADVIAGQVDMLGKLVQGDESPRVRMSAAKGLGAGGSLARPALPALVAAVEDSNRGVRLWATEAIGQVGDPHGMSVAILSQRLAKDESEDVRAAAAETLGLLGAVSRPAERDLVAALGDAAAVVRYRVAEALGKLSTKSAEDALTRALQDEDGRVRRAAEEALRRIRGR